MKSDTEKRILKTNRENRENRDGNEKLILIVEDEFDLGSSLSMLFELYGFRTLRAHNGQKALEMLQDARPDLVLSDCMMPVMDGLALSRHLRNEPATADIPIVLMSAAPQQHGLSEASFDVFIEKPFQFSDLLEKVLQLLSARP